VKQGRCGQIEKGKEMKEGKKKSIAFPLFPFFPS
jgi:hypothetical protein